MTQTKTVPEPDPRSSSFWLQNAWRAAQRRDPLDVVRDAEHLLALAQQRHNHIGDPTTADVIAAFVVRHNHNDAERLMARRTAWRSMWIAADK
jgi:hypothetical protein